MPSRCPFALCLVALAATAGCSGREKTLDTGKLERDIATSFTEAGDRVRIVTCPGEVRARRGGSFLCRAVMSDGRRATVRVTQTDDRGSVDLGRANYG